MSHMDHSAAVILFIMELTVNILMLTDVQILCVKMAATVQATTDYRIVITMVCTMVVTIIITTVSTVTTITPAATVRMASQGNIVNEQAVVPVIDVKMAALVVFQMMCSTARVCRDITENIAKFRHVHGMSTIVLPVI